MTSDSAPETTPPFNVGDQINVVVDDIAFGGDGVARPDGFVVFVPFVLVGEEVRVEITEMKKQFARARLLEVLQPSPDRVEPKCPVYTQCGGCQYQHIDYARQTKIKHKQISDLFHRVGGFPEADVHPVVPCPQPYHYRNRIMVRTQWNREKKDMNVGFLRHDSRLVADVEHCWIAEEDLNEDLQVVRKDPPRRNGIKVVLRKFPEGWTLPPDSFFQNNFHLLPGLVETVADRLKDSGATHLVDAYCGVGFFSMELASSVERYVGIEVDRMAIKAARANAETRNATNGEFIEGTTEEVLPELIQTLPADKTALVIDPPRKGCVPSVLELLRSVKPAQIIYVSCHPATLSRDLKILCADGLYELRTVTPLDMFPQTQHVECVADVRLAK
jgi:tRNA/tmRNA/rRNA uracil-C5-methylase (TrmA/RlmC/RlmD family)